jgi:hypothetical protein
MSRNLQKPDRLNPLAFTRNLLGRLRLRRWYDVTHLHRLILHRPEGRAMEGSRPFGSKVFCQVPRNSEADSWIHFVERCGSLGMLPQFPHIVRV